MTDEEQFHEDNRFMTRCLKQARKNERVLERCMPSDPIGWRKFDRLVQAHDVVFAMVSIAPMHDFYELVCIRGKKHVESVIEDFHEGKTSPWRATTIFQLSREAAAVLYERYEQPLRDQNPVRRRGRP